MTWRPFQLTVGQVGLGIRSTGAQAVDQAMSGSRLDVGVGRSTSNLPIARRLSTARASRLRHLHLQQHRESRSRQGAAVRPQLRQLGRPQPVGQVRRQPVRPLPRRPVAGDPHLQPGLRRARRRPGVPRQAELQPDGRGSSTATAPTRCRTASRCGRPASASTGTSPAKATSSCAAVSASSAAAPLRVGVEQLRQLGHRLHPHQRAQHQQRHQLRAESGRPAEERRQRLLERDQHHRSGFRVPAAVPRQPRLRHRAALLGPDGDRRGDLLGDHQGHPLRQPELGAERRPFRWPAPGGPQVEPVLERDPA